MSCNCVRTACNASIDYTQVPGERILPFAFTLDVENSNLYPDAGEYQRFCYTVEGRGADNSDFVDLSHFVLAVCPFVFAFFADIPVAVETAEQCGGWLWGLIPEREKFAVEYVKGFYLAAVWQELLANLISAYIGAAITRKAFKIGK